MFRKTLFLIFSINVLFCIQVTAQTVEELIEKNIEARGGYEKIKAIKTIKMTGNSMFQGMEAPFTIFAKRPNNLRMEVTIQSQNMVQAYDGETAWMIFPFMGSTEPQKMPEDQADAFIEQADIDGHLVDYKEKGHTVELIGKEDMEGTDVYKLKLTLKNGNVNYIYLDAEYFIELKQKAKRKRQGSEFEVETFFGDYKPINGLMIPHSLESKVGGQTVSQITVEKVEMDVNIDDSIFKMPPKSQEEKTSKQNH
ncbi:MAG: outer membrane lipoprotein carrier protein LolA [bacterium]